MMASSTMQHTSREDAKRARELDEARKAGLAPHEVDAETGQSINPHIPHFMVNAPWYLSQDKPTLTHQKDWRLKDKVADKWYARGARGKQNVKFKKGACENCGATTHKTKECLERPRKSSTKAKYTNEDLARDDVIETIDFDSWAHKRDAYKGYQAQDYAEVIEHFDKVNEARQEVVRQEIAAEKYKEDGVDDATAETSDAAAEAAGEGATDGHDEDKLKDDQQAEFTKVDKRVRTTGGGATGSVRNLRIREDTAKYLLNLDPKSAHYDPKSRSMRADPTPDKPASEKTFAGDNALRTTGDEFEFWQRVTEHTVMEGEKGSAAHVQAAPTQAVMAHEAFKQKKAKLAAKNQQAVLEKYGNASAAAPDKDLLLPESEAYVEYDRAGRVVRGAETVAKSRYDEDVHPGNHASVWGSHWEAGQWGYACCKALHRNAMCLGGKAEAAQQHAAAQMAANAERAQAQRDEAAAQEPVEGSSRARHLPGNSAAVWGTEGGDDEELDEGKVQTALIKLQEAEGQDPIDAAADGANKYNGLAADGTTVTPEEMEAYRRFRARAADPMADMRKSSGAAKDGYDMV